LSGITKFIKAEIQTKKPTKAGFLIENSFRFYHPI
jgi:hypothetical protein